MVLTKRKDAQHNASMITVVSQPRRIDPMDTTHQLGRGSQQQQKPEKCLRVKVKLPLMSNIFFRCLTLVEDSQTRLMVMLVGHRKLSANTSCTPKQQPNTDVCVRVRGKAQTSNERRRSRREKENRPVDD